VPLCRPIQCRRNVIGWARCVAQFLLQQPVHLHLAGLIRLASLAQYCQYKDDSSCINVLRLQIAASDYRRCGLFCRNRSANVVYNGRFSGRHGIKRVNWRCAKASERWANGSAEASLQGAVVNRRWQILSFEAFRVSYLRLGLLLQGACIAAFRIFRDVRHRLEDVSLIHMLHWPNFSEVHVRLRYHLWRNCGPNLQLLVKYTSSGLTMRMIISPFYVNLPYHGKALHSLI